MPSWPKRVMDTRAAGWPRGRPGELNLSTAGFCFRSSTSSAAGLNPFSFCRAFRMRRVGSHTGRSGKFCERTRTDMCAMHAWNGGESGAHPRSSRGSSIAAEAFMSHAPQPRLSCAATARAAMVSRAATTRTAMVRLRDFATYMAKVVSTYYLAYPLCVGDASCL